MKIKKLIYDDNTKKNTILLKNHLLHINCEKSTKYLKI